MAELTEEMHLLDIFIQIISRFIETNGSKPHPFINSNGPNFPKVMHARKPIETISLHTHNLTLDFPMWQALNP